MPALLFRMTGLGDYVKFYAPCVPGNPTFRIFINGSLDLLLFPNYSQWPAKY